MKNLLSLIAAGLIGGIVTVGGVKLIENYSNKQSELLQTPAKYVDYQPGLGGALPDFTDAAEKGVAAVVHIKTIDSESQVQAEKYNRLYQKYQNDPMFQMFGGQIFGFDQSNMQPRAGTGSGVIISNDGYIVTNNHVIEIGDDIEVSLNDGRNYKATVVGKEPSVDLAVLKIDANNLPAMPYGNSDQVRLGQWVLAVGNPFDLNSTVTAGIVSAKGRDLDKKQTGKIESYIQTDAPVNPGNSGGALMDIQGRLVGINTAIVTHTGSYEGYSFAIPVNMVTKVVDDIIKYGSYQRGYLGVEIADLDDAIIKEKNLDIDVKQGVVVMKLSNGGAAQFADVRPRDVITQIDGKTVKSSNDLMEIVASSKVGQTLRLNIVRDGRTMEIPVTLKKGTAK